MYDDLIARLEAATEGSADLDYEIWNSLGTGPLRLSDKPRSIKRYTESLDAALTLWDTPELDHGYPRRGVNLFYAVMPGGKLAWNADAWEQKDGSSVILRLGLGIHRCRPISACIAALKARHR